MVLSRERSTVIGARSADKAYIATSRIVVSHNELIVVYGVNNFMNTTKDKENAEKRIAAAHREFDELKHKCAAEVLHKPSVELQLEYIQQAFELGLIVGLNEAGL